jgi:hypothetical protein
MKNADVVWTITPSPLPTRNNIAASSASSINALGRTQTSNPTLTYNLLLERGTMDGIRSSTPAAFLNGAESWRITNETALSVPKKLRPAPEWKGRPLIANPGLWAEGGDRDRKTRSRCRPAGGSLVSVSRSLF